LLRKKERERGGVHATEEKATRTLDTKKKGRGDASTSLSEKKEKGGRSEIFEGSAKRKGRVHAREGPVIALHVVGDCGEGGKKDREVPHAPLPFLKKSGLGGEKGTRAFQQREEEGVVLYVAQRRGERGEARIMRRQFREGLKGRKEARFERPSKHEKTKTQTRSEEKIEREGRLEARMLSFIISSRLGRGEGKGKKGGRTTTEHRELLLGSGKGKNNSCATALALPILSQKKKKKERKGKGGDVRNVLRGQASRASSPPTCQREGTTEDRWARSHPGERKNDGPISTFGRKREAGEFCSTFPESKKKKGEEA